MDEQLVHNAYPNLPVVPYVRTTIDMPTVIAYINSCTLPTEIKKSVYIIFRIEGGNGNHGVCQNYIGSQADGAQLPVPFNLKVIATCLEAENGTHRLRRFCCFEDFKASVDILADGVTRERIYIGGTTNDAYSHIAVNSVNDLCTAYYDSWVTGVRDAVPTQAYFELMQSMYYSASQHFG